MATDPFAPIGGGGAASPGKAPKAAIMPVPAGAPKPPAAHPTLGNPSASWTYRNADGLPVGFMHRFDAAGGKEFRPTVFFQVAAGAPLWRWESWPAPRPLYGLDRLAARPAVPVIVTEGEKACDAAGLLLPDYVNITSPNGSKSAGKADWSALKGRRVVIWPDADDAGAAYAEAVIECLRKAGAASVALIDAPEGVKPGWDAADAVDEGWDSSRTAALIKAAEIVFGGKGDKAKGGKSSAGSRRRRAPQRDMLMGLTTLCSLWHDEYGEAFVTFPVGNHRETWAVRSQAFKRWLASQAYEGTGLVPGAQAVEDTLRVLEARATNEGQEQSPWLRVGERDGRLYIDLCDRSWRAVEITKSGWSIIDKHELPFIRSQAMRPLPEPEAGDSIDSLRGFINVASDHDFVLVVSWLMASLRPRGPYPILAVNGQQGSGKSTFSRLLRTIVDPNAAPIRAAPKDDRDLIVAAVNSHVLSMDNMSKVEPWLADALCRLATGGGFSTRALHTDRDEIVIMCTRPIIINGIPLLTERADLAERCVSVRLRSIPDEERRAEDDYWSDWSATLPRVLGALCDGLSTALRRVSQVRLIRAPRLADFAKWMVAAEPGLGWHEGTFRAAYDDNRRDVTETTFEADPVAVAIHDMMQSEIWATSGWNGTATELLTVLGEKVSETVRRSRAWPASAQGLGNRIDRVAPLLRGKGVVIERKHSGVRTITIARIDQ